MKDKNEMLITRCICAFSLGVSSVTALITHEEWSALTAIWVVVAWLAEERATKAEKRLDDCRRRR